MLTKEKISFKIKLFSFEASVLLKIAKEKEKNGNNNVVFKKTDKLSKRGLLALKRKNLVKIKKNKEDWGASLTGDGLLEFFKLRMIEADKLPKGEICLVVFDIPEKFKKQRAMIRKFLTDCCFLRIQKSVWKSQFNYSDLIFEFFKVLEIEDWVYVFLAKER
ncbi:MAG: CRISPR-associated endonuclease Cas2 [Candidatus Uhrbacteria bacterium]